jgi:hypothetical protein
VKPPPKDSEKGEVRLMKMSTCGRYSLALDIRANNREIRVRTRIKPKSSSTWATTILQDRHIAWKGQAKRGEVDQALRNLDGSEVIAVRMTDSQGVVCAVELTVPSS